MKIAIATAVYYPQINGVAVFSHNLALGLAARGHEVLVLCPSQTGKNYTRTENGVKVNYLKSTEAKVYPDQIHPAKKHGLFYKHGFKVSVFPYRQIKKALNAFQPDVVHIQVSDPIGLSVVAYARKYDIPVVTTEHNQPEVITDPLKMPTPLKKPMNALLASYFKNRQSKSDFVTMPTKKAIHHLLGSGKPFPVPVAAVSNGVDLSNFNPGRAPAKIYEKYHIDKSAKIALYVGRVDPEKSVGTVIKAFNEARLKVPHAELVIVGDGVDRPRLEALAKTLGIADKVHFLGRVLPPELYELYKLGDVFVTASEIETQGIVLIEAAATGLPLIAVDSGAVSEVCITGKNGYLCKPGDVAEIKDALESILTDDALRTKFSENSLKIASEHDFNHTLDQFINIYERVIKK